MELTRERALELHRQMWTDMQEELGNFPSLGERADFKRKWCAEHGYEGILNNCFFV